MFSLNFNNFVNTVNRETRNLEQKIEIAVGEVTQQALTDCLDVTPISPLGSDTSGDLRRSATARVENAGSKTRGVVAYSARYALAVHEMPSTNNFSEAGTSSKFIEDTLRRNRDKYMSYIKRRAR